RVVAAGDALLSPSITRRLIEEFARRPVPGTPPSQLGSLTDREVEVLKLMSRGLSNAEIARQLYVGEGTVKTHVSHLLTKLQLRDRVQAVVVAYESGLVQAGGARGSPPPPRPPGHPSPCPGARRGRRPPRPLPPRPLMSPAKRVHAPQTPRPPP